MCAARQWAISSWKLLCKSQNKRHFDAVLKKKRSRFFYFVVFGKYHGRARLSYTSSRKYKSFKSIELISNAFMQAPLNASERTNQVHAFISQMRSAHIFLKKWNCAPNDVLFHAPNVPSLRFLSIVFFCWQAYVFSVLRFSFLLLQFQLKRLIELRRRKAQWNSERKTATAAKRDGTQCIIRCAHILWIQFAPNDALQCEYFAAATTINAHCCYICWVLKCHKWNEMRI